jgi:hypothetical protein
MEDIHHEYYLRSHPPPPTLTQTYIETGGYYLRYRHVPPPTPVQVLPERVHGVPQIRNPASRKWILLQSKYYLNEFMEFHK